VAAVKDDNIEIKSFADMVEKAGGDDEYFWRLFAKNWWVIFVWFHFW
jgi:hypothetical protein